MSGSPGSSPPALEPLVLGTAGHVDHGKTTLVRWLTGTDTDRLKEEKERGITIELGFAHLDVGRRRFGVVDVPGHERFVKAMAAGASGIDLVMLVIAADEGVMPQTREHLAICELLGVQRGLVVLTKVDLVDEEWLELVEADLEEGLDGTFLAGSPVVRFSSQHEGLRNEGAQRIRSLLTELTDGLAPRAAAGPFRMPVDRAFVLKGFGTVVTGTSTSGSVAVGDALELLPSGHRCRLRSIQSHGVARYAASAGQRLALNLQGIERSAVGRGDVVARAGTLAPSSMLDARVRLLPHLESSLDHRSRCLLHHGAAQVEAALVPLDCEVIEPGSSALAQLRLAQPVAALPGDRFILRGFSREERHGATIGGGQVLLAHPPRRRRRDREEAARVLARVESGGEAALVDALLCIAGVSGAHLQELGARSGLAPEVLREVLGELVLEQQALRCDAEVVTYLHWSVVERVAVRAEPLLAAYHAAHPRRRGVPIAELESKLPELTGARAARCVLEALPATGRVEAVDALLRTPGFAPRLDPHLEAAKAQLADLLRESGLTPPRPRELAEQVSLELPAATELLEELVTEGRVVRVREELLVDRAALDALRQRLIEHLGVAGEITPQEFKALVGGSRRYTIPLAERFDQERLTLRVGDVRRLRGSAPA